MSKHEIRAPLAAGGVAEIPASKSRGRFQSGRQPIMGEIGFIGLGRMGRAMAANLAAAGRPVIAYVRRPDQIGQLEAIGLRRRISVTCSIARSSSACCRTTKPCAKSCSVVGAMASTV